MTRLRSSDGQVTVMAAVLMVFLVAMVAFVLDVGSWFRQQRISQSTVDAAALAGAQALPHDPGNATTLASHVRQQERRRARRDRSRSAASGTRTT